MILTDFQLIKECLKGDQDSFSELVSRYKKLVYKVVYKYAGDSSEADDLSQEVFIRIYKSLGSYNPEYKFSTWCVKIATNLCLDQKRKNKMAFIPIEAIENVSRQEDTPEMRYVKKEGITGLWRAVASLPEKYRQPMLLYHKKGASYKEIAQILDEPMSIVKNRIYRARIMLKEILTT